MSTAEKTVAQQLATPVQFIKGVGPRAELLAKLGIERAGDVLFSFPRDYQDLTQIRPLAEVEEGMLVSVRATVEEAELRGNVPDRSILGVLMRQDRDYLRAVWFNQPFMRERFRAGQEVLVSGTPKRRGLVWEMHHPRVEWIDADAETPRGRLLPVYRLTEGLNQRQMRQIARGVIEQFVPILEETFPSRFLESHQLCPLQRAIEQIHFPDDPAALASARRRLAYQDLLVMQLALAMKRHEGQSLTAPPLEATAKIDARIRRLFPFEWTPGQEQVIGEIRADLSRNRPMNRLLQGEVGSGKTVAAVYAMLLAVAHGYQAVLMAPTEILARQHWQTLDKLLGASHVRRTVLIGGMPAGERKSLIDAIAAGQFDLVIGTQALLQEDVRFSKLGLVVIDEQHKFGVRQRASLKDAGLAPHYLVMTATPIPRTVGMTMFGDLDVSNLRDCPPGRQPVNTYLAAPEQRDKWWEFVRKKLREGRQAYVIVPLVEDSEAVDASSVEQAFESLANGPLEAFRLGLVHGRMPAAGKIAAMEAFREGQTQVLVSTSVVEVGVDVPNATLMTIEDGERFGLSALHQLRGRIRRGVYPGFCCVFANCQSPDAQERLDAFTKCDDGFELAEIDFRLRGPGNLLGTRQHGLASLRVADLSRDRDLLEEARTDALALVAADPALSAPEFQRLRAKVLRRYQGVLELGDVG